METVELKNKLSEILDDYKEFNNPKDLKTLLESTYTLEWLDRNNNLDWYYSDASLVFFPPVSLVNSLRVQTGENAVLNYLKNLDEIITAFGLERILTPKNYGRLQNPLTAYKTFFELKILKNLLQNKMTLELDHKVKGNKDVEALATHGDLQLYIECKCLGLSDIALNHLKNESLLNGNIMNTAVEANVKLVGHIRFKDYCKQDEWDEIFKCCNRAGNTGKVQNYKSELVDLSIGVLGYCDYAGLDVKLKYPVDERIKSTIIKVKQKLKGTIPCVVFINIPPEIGQGGAAKTIKNLLDNKKNKAISQVILVDWKWTGEEEHYSVFNYTNRHSNSLKYLNWNIETLKFDLVDKEEVLESVIP